MKIFNDFLNERFEKVVPRDAAVVHKALKVINDGEHKQLLTTKDAYIYVPKRFEEVEMAVMEEYFRTIAYYAVVCDGHYAVSSTPAFLSFSPSSIQTIKIGEDEFFELYFEANTVMSPNIRCSKNTDVAYMTYNEFIAKPNMCLFFDYDDALLCLSKLREYGNVTLEQTNVATEIVVATITRDSSNLDESYRHSLAKDKNATPVYIGLRNIQYGVTNLPTATMGSYSDIGIDSMLVKPAKKLENYERLLRE